MSNKVFTPDFANMVVREKADEEPINPDAYVCQIYADHIASLRTIEAPWLDKSKHNRPLVEGKDFRVDKCQRCEGHGYTAEHDIMCDGNCHSCPVQVECENCHATGYTTVPLSPAEPPAGKVWPLLGYAPGNYSNHCANCGKEMSNVDKLCFQCLECAVKCANRIIASVPPAGEGKGEGKYGRFTTLAAVMKVIDEWLNSDDVFVRDGEHGELLPNGWVDCVKGSLLKRMVLVTPNNASPSAPVYPAGFVEWVSDNHWFKKEDSINLWYHGHFRGTNRELITTHELYTGPYQEYLKTLK